MSSAGSVAVAAWLPVQRGAAKTALSVLVAIAARGCHNDVVGLAGARPAGATGLIGLTEASFFFLCLPSIAGMSPCTLSRLGLKLCSCVGLWEEPRLPGLRKQGMDGFLGACMFCVTAMLADGW